MRLIIVALALFLGSGPIGPFEPSAIAMSTLSPLPPDAVLTLYGIELESEVWNCYRNEPQPCTSKYHGPIYFGRPTP